MKIIYWIVLWKAVFIIGVGLFVLLALVVTVGGLFDIRRLFQLLHERHAAYLEENAEE